MKSKRRYMIYCSPHECGCMCDISTLASTESLTGAYKLLDKYFNDVRIKADGLHVWCEDEQGRDIELY